MANNITSTRVRRARSRELMRSSIEPAVTDAGAYAGTVIWEGTELLLQRISPKRAIVHTKGMLEEVPGPGQQVRIVYNNGLATIRRLELERQSHRLER